MLLIGMFLEYTNQSSTGTTAHYDGSIHSGTINGLSAIILGAIILMLSIIAYYLYKKEKEKFNKMK